MLPSDTYRKPITSITTVLLPFVNYFLTLPRTEVDRFKISGMRCCQVVILFSGNANTVIPTQAYVALVPNSAYIGNYLLICITTKGQASAFYIEGYFAGEI
jgi:hypothetical protein